VPLAPSLRRKNALASINCMCFVAGHRLRIVSSIWAAEFESHANRRYSEPRAGGKVPATSSVFQPKT
jgi:hypothetical protein